MIKKIATVVLAVLGLSAWAATDSVFENSKGAEIAYNSKGDIVRGEWTSQFNKARKQAEAENVPLVVFWANNGCGHCATVEVSMDSSSFRKWMKEKKLYMVFCCGGYPGPCGQTDLNDGTTTAKTYAKDKSREFPYIGVWWNKGSKLTKRGTFTGNGKTATQIATKIMDLLPGYKPCVGGYFADLDSGESRYEVEPTTKSVEFVLTRASTNKSAGDDDVKVVKTMGGANSLLGTYKATWKKNATTTSLVVAIPEGFKEGDKLTAVINGETKAQYRCTVTCVAPKANSAGNPNWKGEELDFGVWTADYVGATNLAANGKAPTKALLKAAPAKAYTLVSLQGSLWCPDCANTERNFLDLEEDGVNKFQKWAKEHNVALVSMDIPNYSKDDPNGTGSPTLFSRVKAGTTLARNRRNDPKGAPDDYPEISGADPALTNKIVRSGLSYLTRKGISSAEAAETKELFKTLAQTDTDKGGFHRPEDTNEYRTGVPIFVLLRKDGTVAARLTRLAAVSPMLADRANFDNYIKRFEEMLAIADGDATEIGNNYPSKDSIALPVGGEEAAGEISNADFQDSFRLQSFNGAAVVEATVSGASDAEVTAQFMQEQDGAVVNVGEAVSGKLSANLKLTGDFQKAGASYLLVTGKDIKAKEFDVASDESTVQSFTASVKVKSLNPQEAKAMVPVEAEEDVALNVTEGAVYLIDGATPDVTWFESEGRDKLYVAKATGDATVHASVAGTLTYQKWVAAKIGFNNAGKISAKESDGTIKVKVLRNGGVSGQITATVVLDKENTTFYYDHDDKNLPRFWINGEEEFKSAELVWEDGDGEAKEISVKLEQDSELAKWFGNGQIVLKLQDVSGEKGDAKIDTYANCVISVTETGKQTQCKISILEADPAWSFKPVVYARKGAGVNLKLGRSDVGDVRRSRIVVKSSSKNAKVVAGEGNVLFTSGSQYWEANDYDDKVVHVDLKKMTAGTSATISLSEVRNSKKQLVGFAADASNKQVKIVAVDDTAPAFEKDATGLIRLVTGAYYKDSVAFTSVQNPSKLSVKLIKGSLPKGMRTVVSGGRLYLAGTPTTAGAYAAYFQAQEKRGKKVVKGLVLKASFRVIDPTTVKADDPNYGHLVNRAVKTARTLKSLPVLVCVDGTNRVAGVLTVTIPKSGKISAAYVGHEATVRFAATSWAVKSFDDPDGTLFCKMEKGKYKLEIEAYPDSKVLATLTDPAFPEQDLGALSSGKVWSSSNTAKAWRGIYNAALVAGGSTLYLGNGTPTNLTGEVVQPENKSFSAPSGCGFVNLQMTTKTAWDAGKMVWAGRLANGQKISGTAYLTKGEDDWVGKSDYVYLPIFQKLTEADGSKDLVSVVAGIERAAVATGGLRSVIGSPDLYDGEPLYDDDVSYSAFPLGGWVHTGVEGTGTSYSMDLHLLGSYYDPTKDLRACCEELSVPEEQLLQIVAPQWAGCSQKKRVEAADIKELDHLVVGKDTISIASGSDVPANFTVKLTRSNGILSGTLRIYTMNGETLSNGKKFAEATWIGVMTTGWGAKCGCAEDDTVTLPFICGALSFVDEVPYEKDGVTKTVKPRSGSQVYSGARGE